MDNGKIYHYKSDGTWELADNNLDLVMVYWLYTINSDVDGMLLRGTVTLDHDQVKKVMCCIVRFN